MFAQTRFSVRIGDGDRGYYGQSEGYRSQGYYQPSYDGSYGSGYGSYGYNPDREHRRSEQHALSHHQQEERWQYGSSEALRDHQRQEKHDLKHEQWHERHGDSDAGYGPGHRSASDGYGYRY